jgi:hypothetical protein
MGWENTAVAQKISSNITAHLSAASVLRVLPKTVAARTFFDPYQSQAQGEE